MADGVVGLLRVLLTANTAEFSDGMKKAAAGTKAFQEELERAKTKLGPVETSARGVEQQLTKMVQALSGNNIKRNADVAAAAIEKIGGASKLTTAEAKKYASVINEAIAKSKALGETAPAAWSKLSKELSHATEAGKGFSTFMQTAAGSFAGFISAQAVLAGVSSAFKATIGAAFDMNATLETTTLQFTTLMGDANAAKRHVADLFEFAKKTPFETGPIIAASKALQAAGRDALDTKDNLKLIGDAAAATGAPIDELGRWVGRLYASLQAGRPFGEAAQRLGELNVLTPQARNSLEAMQKSGASATAIFAAFQKELGQFSGAMQRQAGTWEGVMSTFRDNAKMAVATALKPLFEAARDALGAINDLASSDTFGVWADSVAGAVQTLANGLRKLPMAFVGVTGAIQEVRAAAIEFVRDFVIVGARVNQAVADMMAPFVGMPGLSGQIAGTIFGKASKEAQDAREALGPLTAMLAGAQQALAKTELKAINLALSYGAVGSTAESAAISQGKFVSSLDSVGSSAERSTGKIKEYVGWLAQFPGGQWQLPTLGWNGGGGGLYTQGDIPGLGGLNRGSLFSSAMGYGGFKPTQVPGGGFNWGALGLGGLTQALPYLSQLVTGGSQQSQIGGSIGGGLGGILGSSSLFGGLKGLGGFAGVLGGVAPFMGPILGLLGGLIGKLFGPSEGKLASQARGQYITGLGGNEAFNERFRQAQVSPEQAKRLTMNLMSAGSRKEVEAAQAAIEAALARNNKLLAEQKQIEGQIVSLEEERKRLAESLVPTYQDVVAAAERYGIVLEGLGPAVAQLGATTTWTSMLNDIELLTRAGSDMGGILVGMKEEISALVVESLRLGTEIPENMRPYIEELMRSGQLYDAQRAMVSDYIAELGKLGATAPANVRKIIEELVALGPITDANKERMWELVAQLDLMETPPAVRDLVHLFDQMARHVAEGNDTLTDLAGLNWGEPVETDAQKANKALDKINDTLEILNDSLAEIVRLLSGGLPKAAETGAAGIENAINSIDPNPITVRVNYEDSGYTPREGGAQTYAARGGFVPQYHAIGGGVVSTLMRGFVPRGTDTVPAMLTPGELVLTAQQQRALLGALQLSSSTTSALAGTLARDAGGPMVAGGDQTIVVVDGRGTKDDLVNRVMAALPRKTRQNEQSFRTLMREALGVTA